MLAGPGVTVYHLCFAADGNQLLGVMDETILSWQAEPMP
jgi:hypothetical protein